MIFYYIENKITFKKFYLLKNKINSLIMSNDGKVPKIKNKV